MDTRNLRSSIESNSLKYTHHTDYSKYTLQIRQATMSLMNELLLAVQLNYGWEKRFILDMVVTEGINSFRQKHPDILEEYYRYNRENNSSDYSNNIHDDDNNLDKEEDIWS